MRDPNDGADETKGQFMEMERGGRRTRPSGTLLRFRKMCILVGASSERCSQERQWGMGAAG